MSGRLDPKPVPRRDFLSLAGIWAAGIAIVGSMLGMARLPKPRVTPEASSRFRVGQPVDFPPGTVKVITAFNVRLVATEEGVAAMSLICTHLGCIVKETEGHFACPCHGSKFDMNGKVIGGPAPSALKWLSVSQGADGSLVVDADEHVPAGTYFKTA